MRARVEACWRGVLPQARISVFDDIEAVAHAWADGRPCIACVLGTGASSGLYDGRAIRRYAPSNGVWLGDEGSGAYLGKMLVKAYLDELLPEPLRQRFEHDFPDRREQLLAQVYRGERPSAYLGSFAPWLLENAAHPFVEGLLRDSFRQFYARFVGYYGETGTRACLSGGTAFHFMPQLMAAFEEAGAPNPLIAKAVMPGLLRRYGAGS
jgi:N-acetylglucosamine kinase-like BadF-type ATPase